MYFFVFGKFLLVVSLKECFSSVDGIMLSDFDFRVLDDGLVYSIRVVVLSDEKRFFII